MTQVKSRGRRREGCPESMKPSEASASSVLWGRSLVPELLLLSLRLSSKESVGPLLSLPAPLQGSLPGPSMGWARVAALGGSPCPSS